MNDEDLLPIRSLAQFQYCARRFALMFLEMLWQENIYTIEGSALHETAHSGVSESRTDIEIERGLRLRSLSFGLTGVADIVEFQKTEGRGKVRCSPFPVEYKRGKERPDIADEVQLCAQALCLEEMLHTTVPRGAVFYGQPRRRMPVEFTPELRETVKKLCERARELIKSGVTPPPKFGKHCKNCSLVNECVPQIAEKSRAALYVEKLLIEMRRSLPGGLH